MSSDPPLKQLQERLENLPDVNEKPKPLFQLVHLSDEEWVWHRLFKYFLDPSSSHGYDTQVLEQFLTGICKYREINIDLDRAALEEVEVISEEASDATGNEPDIIIKSPKNWFVCIEIKVNAQEGKNQTTRYVEDPYIGSCNKDAFPETGQNYVYISAKTPVRSTSPKFVDIHWKEIIEYISPSSLNCSGPFKQRSEFQLNEFIETIRAELNIDDKKSRKTRRQQTQLYFEYQEEIESTNVDNKPSAVETVTNALHETVKKESSRWAEKFLSEYEPKSWSEDWDYDSDPRIDGLYHSNWRPESNADVNTRNNLCFRPLIADSEVSEFKEGKLTFETQWQRTGGLRRKFRERIKSPDEKDLSCVLNSHGIEVIASDHRITRKVYNVDKSRLPESYYEQLREAFEEHQELVPRYTDILIDIYPE